MLRLLAVMLAMVVAYVCECGPSAHAQGASSPQVVAQNPTLANVQSAAPDAFPGIIRRLVDISGGKKVVPSRAGLTPNAKEKEEIEANPAFRDAFAADPDRTVLLLREVHELLRHARRSEAPRYSERVALVIGAGANPSWGNLRNANEDAKLVASTLRDELYFTLVEGQAILDPDLPRLREVVAKFAESIGPDTIAVLYFAGHGTQFQGRNFLVPAKAAKPPRVSKEGDGLPELYDVSDIVRRMGFRDGRLNIVILDACRDQTPKTQPTRGSAPRAAASAGQGFGKMKGQPKTVIVYSTDPDNVAADVDPKGGKYGPFAPQFSKIIVRPGLEIREVFHQTASAVSEATDGRQNPWIESSGFKELVFLSPTAVADNVGQGLSHYDRTREQTGQRRWQQNNFSLPEDRAEDPLVQLRRLGFSFDKASYFQAVRIGRQDIVALFLKAGMPPLTTTRDDAYGREATALALGIYWKAPNICSLIELFAAQGVAIADPKATGWYESRLMGIAISAENADAARCLKKHFQSELADYLEHLDRAVSIMERLNSVTNPFKVLVRDAIRNCRTEIPYLYGPQKFIKSIHPAIGTNTTDDPIMEVCMAYKVGHLKMYLAGYSPEVIANEWERGNDAMVDILSGSPPRADLSAQIAKRKRMRDVLVQ